MSILETIHEIINFSLSHKKLIAYIVKTSKIIYYFLFFKSNFTICISVNFAIFILGSIYDSVYIMMCGIPHIKLILVLLIPLRAAQKYPLSMYKSYLSIV